MTCWLKGVKKSATDNPPLVESFRTLSPYAGLQGGACPSASCHSPQASVGLMANVPLPVAKNKLPLASTAGAPPAIQIPPNRPFGETLNKVSSANVVLL